MVTRHSRSSPQRRAGSHSARRGAATVHAAASTPGRGWWAHPAFGTALTAFLLYLPSLGGAFIRDDHFLIERHPYLRAGGWLGRLLLGDFWAPVAGATGMWRPLVVLSYWTDGRLGGWNPVWFHVVNAAAHALASGAVALVVLASGGPTAAAWLAALAFAAMPSHAECVAWISGRTDVFCALFGLLAIWLDARARDGGGAVLRTLAAISLALALLSKESGVPLAGVLVVMEWTRMRRVGATWLQSVVWLAPYLLVTAAYLGLHARFAPDPGVISAPDLQSRAGMRGAGWALFPGYFAFLWPWFPHSPDRAAPTLAPTPAGEVAIGAVCAVAAATLFAILLWRRHRAAPAVALALFPLVPPLVLASTRGYGLFGERHMYLPSAGVVWALALALPSAAARLGGRAPQLVWGVCAVLVAGSAVETLRAIPAYRDDEVMYRTMIAREPGNPSGFVGLAEVLTEHGQLDESLTMLARAEALDPALASVFVARARIASKRQDWPAVLAAAERAVGIDAGLWPAWLLHAQGLIHLGRAEEGARELERLHRDYPGQPDVASALGQSWLERGHPLEAMAVLQEAVSLSPGEPALWNALGIAAGQAGRWPDARAAFQRTTELAPRALAGWLRLAAACQRLGDASGRDQALTHAAALPGGAEAVSTFQRRLGGATP